MITYGFSIQGKGHIEKGVVCQDASIVKRIKAGRYAGIVADGVGSAAQSDIGAKLAVKTLFLYCEKHITETNTEAEIEGILSSGYEFALNQIEQYAKKQKADIADFDTTLSAAIYDGETVVFGHAGDGGIVARGVDGNISMATSRQKGADGISVRPLRSGSGSWVFGTVKQVASVLLVTDGMLDGFVQPSLINIPPDRMSFVKGNYKKDRVYVTAAEFLMNPYAVYRNKQIKDANEYMKYFLDGNLTGEDQNLFYKCMFNAYKKFFAKADAAELAEGISQLFYAVWAMQNITDDKSVVCMMNDRMKVSPQSKEFYKEPDWGQRQKIYNDLLYRKTADSLPAPVPEKKMTKPESRQKSNNDGVRSIKTRYFMMGIIVGIGMLAWVVFILFLIKVLFR